MTRARVPVIFSEAPGGVSVNSTVQFRGLIVADEVCDWDFFVSYTQADRSWAEWIAWILEENGYRVLVQAWDFVPGTNWTQHM